VRIVIFLAGIIPSGMWLPIIKQAEEERYREGITRNPALRRLGPQVANGLTESTRGKTKEQKRNQQERAFLGRIHTTYLLPGTFDAFNREQLCAFEAECSTTTRNVKTDTFCDQLQALATLIKKRWVSECNRDVSPIDRADSV
jgi:hypothetical protein